MLSNEVKAPIKQALKALNRIATAVEKLAALKEEELHGNSNEEKAEPDASESGKSSCDSE